MLGKSRFYYRFNLIHIHPSIHYLFENSIKILHFCFILRCFSGRYIDDIQCAAARIVHAIRSSNNDGSIHQFDSFHIRRGDFQYKKTRVSAEEIVDAAKAEIPIGSTVYIGTDERRKEFFNPLKEHGWNLLFLDDFKNLLGDIDTNYYGMM